MHRAHPAIPTPRRAITGPPIRRCDVEGCTRPIGDGDWVAGYRRCVWCRGPIRAHTASIRGVSRLP